MKIDIHTHILPKDIPNYREKFGYGEWIQMKHHYDTPSAAELQSNKCIEKNLTSTMIYSSGKHFRDVSKNTFDPTTRLQEMDATGVDVQVLSTVPIMFSYWAKPSHCLELCQFLNQHMAGVIANEPTRFVGLGTVPMQDSLLAVEEIRRIKSHYGLSGIQIGSQINDLALSDKLFHPIYKACETLDVPIFVHPWDMETQGHWSNYWMPWLVGMPARTCAAICSIMMGNILELFPRLRFCFAHGGGSFAHTIGRIDHGYRVRPDLCAVDSAKMPSELIDRIFVDSLVHDKRAMSYLIDVFSDKNICLGSDYPFPLGETVPGSLIESMSEITEFSKKQILSENIINFIGKENWHIA